MSRELVTPIVPENSETTKYLTCNKCGDERPLHWFPFCSRDKKYRSPCKPCQAKNRERLIGQLSAKDQGKKFCTHCDRILPYEDFWKSVVASDGLNSRCMDCQAQDEYQRKRRRNIQAARKTTTKDGYKVCHKCLDEIPEHWFALNNKKTGYRQTICRICTSRKPDLMRNKLVAIDNGNKWCNKCKSEKSESEFAQPYQNGSYCKLCRNIALDEWVEKNPDKVEAYRQKERDEYVPHPRPEPTPEELEARKEKEKERRRKWRMKDKALNPEKYRRRERAWRKKNPKRVKARDAAGRANRRANELKNGGKVSTEQVLILLKAQENKCFYCCCALDNDYHVDHLTPVSRGGGSEISNLACTCETCNLQKNDKTLKEYIDWIFEKKEIAMLDQREYCVFLQFTSDNL